MNSSRQIDAVAEKGAILNFKEYLKQLGVENNKGSNKLRDK